ncbi:hypothetical protein C2E25_04475 [Geothermobacter hydrogeniphilus]|uniref:Uncharacterized protein n=1 Tax=Geothermobacter hydrogeniphilus TaxID=1969733 RepID=A0A2K2HCT6_9BACT|nr:hypothetical protein C2E25_04475 [Geothermobacter hydrogeniphilus]
MNGVPTGRIGERPYWVLNATLLVRAAHQVGVAVFLAAFLLDAVPGPPKLYIAIAVGSGILLMLSEWMRHRQIFRELAGMITMLKLLLVGAAFHGILPPAATVLLAFLIASIGAHAPKNIRHRLLF